MTENNSEGTILKRGIRHVFSVRNYRFLWFSATGSAVGSSIAYIAIAWVVFEKTQSPFAITMLGIVRVIPSIVFGLIGGALADRISRKRLMIAIDAIRATMLAILAISIYLIGFKLMWILTVVGIVSAMGAIYRPSSSAILPTVIEKEDLPDANGFLFSGMTVGNILGNTLGGIVVTTFGICLALSENSFTFAIAAIMVMFIVMPKTVGGGSLRRKNEKTRSMLRDISEGLGYVRKTPALLWTIMGSLIGNFSLSLFSLYIVIYVADLLSAGSWAYGAIIACQSLGYAIGSYMVGKLGTVRHTGWTFALGWSFAGLLIVGIAMVHEVAFVALFMSIIGILSGIANTTYISCVQQVVPNEMLGRFMSIDEVGSFAVIPLGQIVGGVLVMLAGIETTFAIAGLGVIVSSFATVLSRDVRNLGYSERTESV